MKNEDIDQVAYTIKKAKGRGKGITVFLGAGMSDSAGIPTAGKIVEEILSDTEYNTIPKLKKLSDSDKTNYAKIMSCLDHEQRKELFTKYVNNSKVNVAHIYLAHMIKEGFVDYVLTPNFDDLMLKALALFNIFPPVYDLAMLDSLDTTTLGRQTVVYLHGRHNGIWQLNTEDEMEKVKDICGRLFNKIQDRPWLVMGYGGSDKIFDRICELGRFSHHLYWVGWLDKDPNDNVCTNLLKQKNRNAYLVRGYDADSFMIKLHNELNIDGHPQIFAKPFSHISELLSGIVDIDNKKEFSSVKKRLDISKKHVKDAIKRYEEKPTGKKLGQDKLHKDILDLIANEDFDETKVRSIEDQVIEAGDEKAKELLSNLYFSIAYNINKEDEKSFLKAINYNQKSIDLFPNPGAYFNLGNSLIKLGKLRKDKTLLEKALSVLKTCEELGGDVYNLACAYALLKNKTEALSYLEKSFIRKEGHTSFVSDDDDWKEYREDPDFKSLIEKYNNTESNI